MYIKCSTLVFLNQISKNFWLWDYFYKYGSLQNRKYSKYVSENAFLNFFVNFLHSVTFPRAFIVEGVYVTLSYLGDKIRCSLITYSGGQKGLDDPLFYFLDYLYSQQCGRSWGGTSNLQKKMFSYALDTKYVNFQLQILSYPNFEYYIKSHFSCNMQFFCNKKENRGSSNLFFHKCTYDVFQLNERLQHDFTI